MAGEVYSTSSLHLAPVSASGGDLQLRTAAIVWGFVASVLMLLFALDATSLPVGVCFVLFGVIGLGSTRLLDRTSARLFTVVYGSASVVALALFFYYKKLYGVPYFLGGSDELHYEEMGELFAQTLSLFDYGDIRGNIVPAWHNSVAYVYVVGVLYKFAHLFGEAHTMVPRLFNVLLLALTAVGIYRLACKLGLSKRTAIACGLATGCLPLMMYVSVQTLRDIVVAAVLVGAVNAWTPMPGHRVSILKAVVLTAVFTALLIDMRRAQALVIVLIAVVGFLSSDTSRRPIVWVPTLIATLIAATGAFVVLSEFVDSEMLFLVGQADYYDAYRVEEVGGGLSAVVFTTPPPLGWLLRTAYALASPFPEMSLELDKLWISSGTIVQISFVPFLFVGLSQAVRDRHWWPVLSAMGFLFIGMAMFTFQGRHIVQYLPFAVLLTALGYSRLERVRTTVFVSMIALGMVLAVIYLILKS
jgi:hypothetical protein